VVDDESGRVPGTTPSHHHRREARRGRGEGSKREGRRRTGRRVKKRRKEKDGESLKRVE
jgi:3'-phosphoadenosine 5'-phosphosulfate sulfotransferase (PAPS reductase)/FAD synthetase